MIEKTILAAEYQNFKGRFPKWQQPLLSSLNTPSINTQFQIIPKKGRGRQRTEDNQIRRLAELIIQRKEELKAQGQNVTYKKIMSDFSDKLAWREKNKLKAIEKTIQNNITALKKSR